jgi:hypothetical protein
MVAIPALALRSALHFLRDALVGDGVAARAEGNLSILMIVVSLFSSAVSAYCT